MKCSLLSVMNFLGVTILYGSAYAIVSLGLEHFTAGLFQALRMVSGLVFCVTFMLVRMIINKNDYRRRVILHFTSGFKPLLHLVIGGLINLAVPHILISVAQQWVSSASVQLMQPFSTGAGALVSHFALTDEPFTLAKGISLAISVVGVVLTGIPSFTTTETTPNSTQPWQSAVGYLLVITSMAMFGIAPVFFRLKTPNVNITVSVVVQLLVSSIFSIVWALIFDGYQSIGNQLTQAPVVAFIWPVIVGTLVSGVAIHGFMYMVETLGTFGANLMPFGQIIVGLLLGIFLLSEWEGYSVSSILMSVAGVAALCASMVIGFCDSSEPSISIKEEGEKSVETFNEIDSSEGYEDPEKNIPEL